MANSYIEYTQSGTTNETKDVSALNYLSINDLKAYGVNTTADPDTYTSLTVGSQNATAKTIQVTYGGVTYNKIRIYRQTAQTTLVDFQRGSAIKESDLDKAYQQGLFVAQELAEDAYATSVNTVTLLDDSVNGDKIADNSIANNHINGTAINLASNVTGVLPVANGGSGVSTASNEPCVVAKLSGTQALTASTETTVNFNSTDLVKGTNTYDTSTSKFYPRVAGWYLLYADIQFTDAENGSVTSRTLKFDYDTGDDQQQEFDGGNIVMTRIRYFDGTDADFVIPKVTSAGHTSTIDTNSKFIAYKLGISAGTT